MNDTPCPDCNFYNWRVNCAYTRRDWTEVRKWQDRRITHQAECPVINGDWYKGLWANAQVADAARKTEGGMG